MAKSMSTYCDNICNLLQLNEDETCVVRRYYQNSLNDLKNIPLLTLKHFLVGLCKQSVFPIFDV